MSQEDTVRARRIEAIEALRRQVGSHDKLAAKLGTTRNTVIQWEKGRFPRQFVAQLVAEGVPEELLLRSDSPRSRAALEQEVGELRDRLATIEAAQKEERRRFDSFVESATARLAALEAVPALQARPEGRRS